MELKYFSVLFALEKTSFYINNRLWVDIKFQIIPKYIRAKSLYEVAFLLVSTYILKMFYFVLIQWKTENPYGTNYNLRFLGRQQKSD